MKSNPWDEIKPPANDVSGRRVDHTHDLDLFWARDHFGHYLFIYEFMAEKILNSIKAPNLKGIQTIIVKRNTNVNKDRLVLLLNEQSEWEIFLSLCNDLIMVTKGIKNTESALKIMIRRLNRWREFLKLDRGKILTEDKIKGLIGELIFIKEILINVFGSDSAIKFWQGPEGLPQDFNINDSAVEVKCQFGAKSPNIKITSADQLCPQLPEMYLFVVTLGKTIPDADNSVNLPLLIESIKNYLQAEGANQLERFNDLLLKLGYVENENYLEYNYILTDKKMYEVKEGFPKICSNQLPDGITAISYNINLHDCERFIKTPEWMEGYL